MFHVVDSDLALSHVVEPLAALKLLNAWSLFIIYCQAKLEELLCLLANLVFFGKLRRSLLNDVIQQVIRTSACKRITRTQQVVTNDTKRPCITFFRVTLPAQDFRRHCQRRPTHRHEHIDLTVFFRKPKISQLDIVVIVDQNVGQFQVSMCDVVFVQVSQRMQNFVNVSFGNSLRDFVFLFNLIVHVLMQVSLTTHLKHRRVQFVLIVLVFEDIEAPDDVGMVEFLDNFDFFLNVGWIVLSDGFENFDCKDFFC